MVFFPRKKRFNPSQYSQAIKIGYRTREKTIKFGEKNTVRQLCKMDIVFNLTCQLKIWKDKQMN